MTIGLVIGVVVLVLCGGLFAYAQRVGSDLRQQADERASRRADTWYTADPEDPEEPAEETGPPGAGYPTVNPSASGPAAGGPARTWVLAAPDKAGTMRRTVDAVTVRIETERQRSAGVAAPYAQVYADPLDGRYRVIVTGQVGPQYTANGPPAAIGAWYTARKQAEQAKGNTYETSMAVGPGIGVAARCMGVSTDWTHIETWCVWAADGVVVEFVFEQVPLISAKDRMNEMLPAIVTWT